MDIYAESLFNRDKYTEAIDVVSWLMENDGVNTKRLQIRANCFVWSGQYDKALKDYMQLIRYPDAEASAFYGLGVLLANDLNRPKEGLQYLQIAVDMNVNFFHIDSLAEAYEKIGDKKNSKKWKAKAEDVIKKAEREGSLIIDTTL